MSGTGEQGLAQAVHDIGSALWFGGSVMGVAGVNKSGQDLVSDIDRIRVASSAWKRFAPAQWAGVAATLIAGTQLTKGSAGRLLVQHGYARTASVKAAVVVLGAVATGYAAYSGGRVGALAEDLHARGERLDVQDASIPGDRTPEQLATWQRRQRTAQYLVPVLSGANVVLNALLVQSYRAGSTGRGVARRLLPG